MIVNIYSPDNYILNYDYAPSVYWFEMDLMSWINSYSTYPSDIKYLNIRPTVVPKSVAGEEICVESMKRTDSIIDISLRIDFDDYFRATSKGKIDLELKSLKDSLAKINGYLGFSNILLEAVDEYIFKRLNYVVIDDANYKLSNIFDGNNMLCIETSPDIRIAKAGFPLAMSALWSLQFGFVNYVRISNNDSSIVINGDFKSFIVSFLNNDEQLCETMVINSINSKYLPKRIVVSQKEYDSKHVMSYYDVLEIIKRLYNNDFRGGFDQQ